MLTIFFFFCITKQNFHCCPDSNPRQLHEQPLHCQHVTVWCCVENFGVTGLSFSDEGGYAVAVNSDHYTCSYANSFLPELNRHGINTWHIWFKERATAHITRASMKVTKEMVPGHIISRAVTCHGLLDHMTFLFVNISFGRLPQRESVFKKTAFQMNSSCYSSRNYGTTTIHGAKHNT